MIGGERPKLILGYDEEGKFKIDRVQAELLGLTDLTESEHRWLLTKPDVSDFQKLSIKFSIRFFHSTFLKT